MDFQFCFVFDKNAVQNSFSDFDYNDDDDDDLVSRIQYRFLIISFFIFTRLALHER